MKNLLLLVLVAFALYLYTYPKVETQDAPPPVVARATPAPKLYYHSPLDAPAMSTSASSGMGYYSAEPGNSRFVNQGGLGASSSVNGRPTYYGGGGTTVIYNNSGGTGTTTTRSYQPQPTPRAYVSGSMPRY